MLRTHDVYVGVAAHDADLNTFFYSGSYMDMHHADATCPLDDVVACPSNDLVIDDDSETDGEEPVQGPCEVELNNVSKLSKRILHHLNELQDRRISPVLNEHEILKKQRLTKPTGIDLVHGGTCTGVRKCVDIGW